MAADHAPASTSATTTPVVVESAAPARSHLACGLRSAQETFIQLWGQMGSNWGIPRTMAEVHALLYITGRPLNADDVMDMLQVSRGNASMTLRNLVDWGLVQRTHIRGDRKEYYTAEQDVWKMFRTVMRERKKREIDPLMEQLHQCREQDDPSDSPAEERVKDDHNQRLDDMLEVLTLLDRISQRLMGPTGAGVEKILRLLTKATSP